MKNRSDHISGDALHLGIFIGALFVLVISRPVIRFCSFLVPVVLSLPDCLLFKFASFVLVASLVLFERMSIMHADNQS